MDMDNDGDLDIFAVSNYQGSNDPPGELNEVYRNGGSFTFTPETGGALESASAGQGAIALDYDNDGDIDVIAGNGSGPLNVLRNDGTGVFSPINPETIGLTMRAGNGITAADVNNDGLIDLLLDQHLFVGTGNGEFTFATSFETSTSQYMGGFADLDNDGDFDLVFPGRNYSYLNNGSGSFTASQAFSIGAVSDPRSVSFADIDQDGDLDFYYSQKAVSDLLIRNDTQGAGNWAKVSLVRSTGQVGAYGARVTIYEAGGLGDAERRIAWREATSATGYLAQDDPVLHFGLGAETSFDIRVEFQGGAVTGLSDIPANIELSISEAFCPSCGPAVGETVVSIQHEGQEREYLLYVPSSYRHGQDTPLLLAFHDTNGNAVAMAGLSELNTWAEQYAVLVAYPEGLLLDGIQVFDAGLRDFSSAPRDDVDFARAIVDDVAGWASVDRKRVYSTGFSNGARVSYRIACEAAYLVAAIAPVAGVLSLAPEECNPSRPVPAIHFHGTADTVAPY